MVVANAQRYVFGWYILDGLHRCETDQGLIVFALGIPAVVLTSHAGAWADRHSRRKILLVTQVAGACVMGVTALLITRRTCLDVGNYGGCGVDGGYVLDRATSKGGPGALTGETGSISI